MRTPTERVELACAMSESFNDIVRAGIIVRYGPDGEAHMRKYLLLALYGKELDRAKLRRILDSWGEA